MDILEIYSPKRFTAMASKLGLKPGFAVDLSEVKPYGPHNGQPWDLTTEEDVKELEEMQDFEQPVLMTGSPPCDPFRQLLRLSAGQRDVAKQAE